MFRSVPRPLLSLMILLSLLFSCHSWAQADAAQMYLALNHTNMFSLAGPLAYYAEQSGADVALMDTTKPTDPVFYRTEDSGDLSTALEQHGKFKELSKLVTHTCDFLSNVGDHIEFTDADVDLYLLFGYARQEMVIGDYDPDRDTFVQENLAGAYEKVTELMLAHENLRLHFYWPSYEAPQRNRDMFDDVLQRRFGEDRVLIDVSQTGKIDAEFIVHSLERALPSHVSHTSPIVFGADGLFPYASGASAQLLTLSFPADATPDQVFFIPDEPQDDSSSLALYPSGNGIFWLYLPADAANGAFQAVYDNSASPLPVSATMLARTIPSATAELTLRDAQGNNVTDEAILTLFNEPTHWQLDVRFEGFSAEDLVPTLYADVLDSDGVRHSVQARLSANPDILDDCTCRFEATLPALGPSSSGTLSLRYTIWGQQRDDAQLDIPFAIENRAPILAQGVESPVQIDAYYDFDGIDPSVFTLTRNMRDFFVDEDGDALTFTIDRPYIKSFERSHDFADDVLTYTATDRASSPYTLTVTASDPFGESVACAFTFTHVSANSIIDHLRAAVEVTQPARYDSGIVTLPIYEETTLRFTISGDELDTLARIFAYAHLPSPYECLRLYAGDVPLALECSEDGGVISAALPIAAQEHLETRTLELGAQLVYPSGSASDIPSLFDPTSLQIVVENTPPYLRNGIETERDAGSQSLSGLPNQYSPVSLRDLFGPIVADTLFANDEALETLQYIITVQGGDAQLYDPSSLDVEKPCAYEESDGIRTFCIDGRAAALPLDLRFYSTGDVRVQINACDADGQLSAQSVRFAVKLTSSFIRLMIIAIVAVFVLAAVCIVLLILHRKRMPSFEGCVACISNARSVDDLNNESYIVLPLSPYGKDPVAVSALLVASGQMPLRTCSPEALAHIFLQPDKRNGIHVTRSGQEADTVSLRVGSQEIAQSATLKYEEYLLIKTAGGEVLCLRIRNAR